jgi:hypothetical protein
MTDPIAAHKGQPGPAGATVMEPRGIRRSRSMNVSMDSMSIGTVCRRVRLLGLQSGTWVDNAPLFSLNAMASPAARDSGPLVTLVRNGTVDV